MFVSSPSLLQCHNKLELEIYSVFQHTPVLRGRALRYINTRGAM